MKYILIAMLAFYAATGWLYWESTRGGSPDSDLGYGIMSFVVGCGAAIITVIYISLAFWNHRFL